MLKQNKILNLSSVIGIVALFFWLMGMGSALATTCANGKYSGTDSNCTNSSTTLQRGSRCDKVCVLQSALNNVLPGLNADFSPIAVDGQFGPETEAGVLIYQNHSGFTASGVADQQVLAKLGLASAGGTEPGAASGAIGPDCAAQGMVQAGGTCVPPSNQNGLAGSTTLVGLIVKVIQYLLTFAGMIAVGMLVVGGFWYITAGGNEETSEKGRKTIMNAIIGVVVVLMAYAIITILSNLLTSNDIVTAYLSKLA
ncbi:MAG: peptidoglycan-binding protein [Patescibacteria group bacterium]|nr:peptidoglycan-binding protein [Patescibacteria group bacterium]